MSALLFVCSFQIKMTWLLVKHRCFHWSHHVKWRYYQQRKPYYNRKGSKFGQD